MALEKPLGLASEDVKRALAPLRNDFSVAVISPGNAFAVGAIIRVAHSFLAREVFVVGNTGWYPKASMGMQKYETIRQVSDVAQLCKTIAHRPLWAVEKDEARRSIQAVATFPTGVVFAFGNERFGLPRELLDRADDVIAIPIYGVNHSLPVTVAAGIVMHEWARRRYVSGACL
ncbi:MAG: TrmH family RNA methyltransferase [Polyangiaceae bacterium]|jgi:tRNA G18 (ribose-2'-O)-methylase SpoU